MQVTSCLKKLFSSILKKMFPKCFHFVLWIAVFLQLKGTDCFFVKSLWSYSYTLGYCFNDTGQIQSSGSWRNLTFLGFSYNSCLDPAAQFRFRDNGAMLNLKRQGCLAAFNKNVSGENLDMFYLYVDSVSLDTAACAQKPNESIYRAITQTPEGGLSVYYKGKDKSSFQTWCAEYQSNYQFYQNYGIYNYIGLTTPCHFNSYWDRRFIFGSVTCHGDNVKNANCPKDQYMVVKFATYRGLLGTKTCGLSDDYSCEVDVTCLVKKQCDGLHECNITVDDNLFSGDLCAGLSNYLYFEYQCVDTVKPFNELCVHDVSLSYSSLPYEGVVQITIDGGTKNVCWESLKNWAKNTVCYHLGYYYSSRFLVNITTPTDAKNATFSGSIKCNGEERYLSQCSINASTNDSCSELSYIQCRWYYGGYYKPLLEDKRRFTDSSFSASASSEGHRVSDARISSGSSWCAPVSNDNHYLQVDLGRLYDLYDLVTYGDSTSPKWVASYNLNYTIDLLNWKTVTRIFQGNKNAYDRAALGYVGFDARALRFIPLTYVGQPCMRVEISGRTVLPDKPINLTVTNITSRSAEISWLDPKDHGRYGLSQFRIKLKKENSLILNITRGKVNEYEINNLTSSTTYEISVAAGNDSYGFGEESNTSFSTTSDGSVTCHSDKVKNANCPKDQYMVVKFATYRGLLAPKTCGLSDDYSCEVDVTCLVKKQCDGLHECNITVDDNLFSGDLCPGLSNYLYFKYQCVDTVKPFKEPCVYDVSLSYSSLPYKGVVQITTESGTKNVCWESLQQNYWAKHIVCRHLGYHWVYSLFNVSTPTDAKNATFSGSINCNGGEKYLSQCSINASASDSCSKLSYIQCRWYYRTHYKPLLEDKRRFPDSSFRASASSEGHSASDARISSGSSWCAPVSDEKHYLQVDFGRLYEIDYVVTYGDRTSPKWVATYNLNYTNDSAMNNWKTVARILQGNRNAYNYAALGYVSVDARALRFIPLTYVVQPCMRVEIWGRTVLPDKPINLTVTNITSRSAEIFWADPRDHGRYGLLQFWIKLKKENSLIRKIITGKVNEYKINNLTPDTTYEISVAAGNYSYGFGKESSISFSTTSDDIDECKNPSLYSCHSGFDCVNTLSSYECVCNGRIANGKCEDEGYTRYRLNLRLKEEYTNALSNNASQEFKAIETRITNAMAKVYENNDAYYGIEVKKMKNGSVVAEMELIFTDKNKKGISELLEAVRNNSFGDFDVDPNALTVVMTGTCESQQCPGNSTCKQLTADTISCPCNDGYYYDGVSCKEFIVIKVEVALEKEFTEELKNKSSQVYQELERNITAELYETFKDTPNFQEVVVLGFRNGSVIVDFKVVYRKDKNNKKIVVAETVREQIVKTGKLGNYQVKSAIVQGSPPPPAGLKETGKTDNSIDISWEKPKGHSAFVINGYMVRHKTDAETQYKNQYISSTSGVLNAVLTGLESDTIYEITVHAYNNDGNGTKLKIQVTTEKPDDSTTVVIIVVVIVIVLLLIIAMVVFFQLRKRRYRYETRRAAYANRSNEGPMTMGLATMPYKSTNYDNYGQTDEEASTSQKL